MNTFSPSTYTCSVFNRFLATPLLVYFVAPPIFLFYGSRDIALRNRSVRRENRIGPETVWRGLWGKVVYDGTTQLLLLFPINEFYFFSTLCLLHTAFPPQLFQLERVSSTATHVFVVYLRKLV